ncbi:hypothetical protein DBR32_11905 [Taibaiella sp. KBW10]|uniref:SRPBCC family protein n=1 Tax=Taibaiella sp. KBW10 TaxID=2153357 RepID=UPI000F593579|nr:SRPBCC family protein [Taibaiella sp. KBW10]RQO30271.1 hypothetical protein DBR32_11905 [Taibaiella sp. KBW10]
MVHTLVQKQWLPLSVNQAWQFFATPANLNEITPADMVFEIVSEVPEKMFPGLMIFYVIRPFLNIPLKWRTEITQVKEEVFFIDEQRKGPYKLWHHEHHFEAQDGGVLMTDILHYDIGKSVLGWLAGKWFVHQKVKQIFAFRRQKLEVLFPSAAV